MKLITTSIVYYLLIGLPLLAAAGAISYYVISTEVNDGVNESLEHEQQNAFRLLQKLKPDTVFYLSSDSLSYIRPTSANALPCRFRDSVIFDPAEKENDNYRFLSCGCEYNGGYYEVTVSKPLFEEDELIEGLVSSLFVIIASLVAAFLLVNWLLARTLWKPFNHTLEALGSYDVARQPSPGLRQTRILEFQRLNEEVLKMTERAHRDYLQQKEFTENAAHELQTPLALIKVSLDQLFQSAQLNESEMTYLQTIEAATGKLAALNKALLLITRIENRQFSVAEEVNLRDVIGQQMDIYSALYASKQISAKRSLAAKQLMIHPLLAELLVGNLVKNAFRHTPARGHVDLELTDTELRIANSGDPMKLPPDQLFGRFVKNDASSDSLGLGLAIVKSIVEFYGYSIRYEYGGNYHRFYLKFH